MSLDLSDIQDVKSKGEIIYRAIGKINCPYLKRDVSFNSQGLTHLKFKDRRRARSKQDQYMRFKILGLAPKIISKSNTVQGVDTVNRFEKVRINSRTDTLLKTVNYYEFVAVINQIRAKVIVKQIENGEPFFWSIIPNWKISDTKRILYSSKDLELD